MTPTTTATLRGISYVPPFGSWIAVGDRGTILTNESFSTWSALASGTSQTLRGIAYATAPNRVVVVGDEGTILTRETNSNLWVPRASGTTAQLHAVTFGPDGFIVVGSAGTVLFSVDGITWQRRESGPTETLTSVAYGNGLMIIAGPHPAVLVSADGGRTFQRRTVARAATRSGPNTVTYARNRFYLSGDHGTFTTTDGETWFALAGEAATTEAVHGAVFFDRALLTVGDRGLIRDEFGGTQAGDAPVANWRAAAVFNNSSMIVVGENGQAAFRSSPLGLPGSVTVAEVSPVGSGFDRTFQPNPNARVDAVLPLPDGRMIVTGLNLAFNVRGHTQHGIARLNRDGSVDPAFDAGAGFDSAAQRALPGAAGITAFNTFFTHLLPVAQSDRKIALFAYVQIGPRPEPFAYLAAGRLNPDGTRDASFQPAPELRTTPSLPLQLTDGRWLRATPSADADGNRIVRLHRFSADGAIDAAFGTPSVHTTLRATNPPPGLSGGDHWNRIAFHTMDAQGRIYLVTTYDLPPWVPSLSFLRFGLTGPKTLLVRLNADGTPDETFPPRAFGEIASLSATEAGLMLLETAWDNPQITAAQLGTTTLRRLRFDGSADPTYRTNSFTHPIGLSSFAAAERDGSVHVLTQVMRGHRGIVRFTSQGEYDADFAAELGASISEADKFVAEPGGSFLIASRVGGTEAGFLSRVRPLRNASATRLANLSIRAHAGRGAETLIAGCIVHGGEKSVLARGAGPALTAFGIAGTLPDPEISLHAGSQPIAANNDWGQGPASAIRATGARLGAFPFADGSRDAALLATLPSGGHTVHLSSPTNASGVALLELYDADLAAQPGSARLANFSALGRVGPGNDGLTAGFILRGEARRNVLLRAIGPGLARFGVAEVLTNPVLTLFRNSVAVARSNNWDDGSATDTALGQEAARLAGAFPLIAGSTDAQLIATLEPGAYTIQVTGASGLTGSVLVEVHEIP